jgi:hypothetical protein
LQLVPKHKYSIKPFALSSVPKTIGPDEAKARLTDDVKTTIKVIKKSVAI